jgi:hypothetical protein
MGFVPCIQPLRPYHEDMDSSTFDAPQRIMDAMRPRVGRDRQSTDDWLRVTAWMDQVATEIDDLATLGTDDPRRMLRQLVFALPNTGNTSQHLGAALAWAATFLSPIFLFGRNHLSVPACINHPLARAAAVKTGRLRPPKAWS